MNFLVCSLLRKFLFTESLIIFLWYSATQKHLSIPPFLLFWLESRAARRWMKGRKKLLLHTQKKTTTAVTRDCLRKFHSRGSSNGFKWKKDELLPKRWGRKFLIFLSLSLNSVLSGAKRVSLTVLIFWKGFFDKKISFY